MRTCRHCGLKIEVEGGDWVHVLDMGNIWQYCQNAAVHTYMGEDGTLAEPITESEIITNILNAYDDTTTSTN